MERRISILLALVLFSWHVLADGDLEFESAAAPGGRIAGVGYLEANGYADEGEPWARYFLTDHRGSTVGVFNGFAGVLDEGWYFPSGARISVPAPSYVNNNDYLYCGKERQTFFGQGGWYDFEGRYLDTEGHFTSLDPLCEKYYPVSPYSFCAGDPVNYVDPDGTDFRRVYVGNTIIIKAEYAVPDIKSLKSAQRAISFWNNRTDSYSENGKEYRIKYKLNVRLNRFGSPNNSFENTFKVVEPKDLDKQQAGKTLNKKIIEVRSDYAETTPEGNPSTTGAHEIGHTLGMSHDDTTEGIMSKSQDEKRNNSVAKENIEQMIKSNVGILEDPNLFERLFNK